MIRKLAKANLTPLYYFGVFLNGHHANSMKMQICTSIMICGYGVEVSINSIQLCSVMLSGILSLAVILLGEGSHLSEFEPSKESSNQPQRSQP